MFSSSEHTAQAHLFADGELSPPEAAAYERHLADCSECQDELDTILLLRGRMLEMAAARQRPVALSSSTGGPQAGFWGGWTRQRALAVSGAVAVSLMVIGVAVTNTGKNTAGAAAATALAFDRLAADGQRPLLERLAYGPAAGYRPPPAILRATRAASAAPIETVAALRDRGDRHGELALWLWVGDTGEALAVDADPSGNPDVENDVAVLAMRQSRLDEALTRLQRVLRDQPQHAAALWNRALVFEQRREIRSAIRDYEAVAARQEPGWSDEARARAARLRRPAVPLLEAGAPR
jgi:cellulose synthase operon protein C